MSRRLYHSLQFIAKAPGEIIDGIREKASEAEEKLTLTKNRLTFLRSTAVVAGDIHRA